MTTDSLRAFNAALPEIPPSLREFLLMQTIRGSAAAKLAKSLASRGFLGCWPLAEDKDNVMALRLQPKLPFEESSVVDIVRERGDAMTFAPAAPLTIAGRLAELDLAAPGTRVSAEQARELRAIAAAFGDQKSTERVLRKVPAAKRKKEPHQRRAALFAAVAPGTQWSAVMEGAWTYRRTALRRWVDAAVRKWPDDPIVRRLYVAHHVEYETGVDITDVAFGVIEGDTVYDIGYSGSVAGYMPGWLAESALVDAVHWLQQHGDPKRVPVNRRALWDAAVAFASSPKKYDGSKHLAFARSVAAKDPELAYVHTCNAALFFARAKRRTPTTAIQVARQLAKKNGWKPLSEVLAI
jgi:hypothetical protein